MCINKYVCVLYMEHLGFDIFETLGILESHPEKQAFKDVCPIQNGDVALLCWFTGG